MQEKTFESQPAKTSPVERIEPKKSSKKRLWRHFILIGVPVVVITAILYYWFFLRPYESTDDAFIDSNVITIAPQVPGEVVKLLVGDNQSVKRGDVLIEIDPRDYEARLAQSQASLEAALTRREQAKAQLASDQAKVEQEQASHVSAQTESERSQADLKRYQSMISAAVSRSDYDLAVAQARSDKAGVDVALSRIKTASAQVMLSKAAIETASAEVNRNEAAVRQSQIELSYTRVIAPEDGFVTHRTVEAGAYVQSGQALLALVPLRVWVVANFKETQLTHMRPGQSVEIKVDAYPHHSFHGHVDSIQRGSGARFSLLPPENATGNYVKVVQRVPVKILFDDQPDPALPLGPGMSVVPVVRTLGKGKNGRE